MLDRSSIHDALKAKAECLTPQQLEKLAEGSATSDPHLATCPRCQAELALLKSFESGEPLPNEGASVAWISAHLERRLDQIKHPGRRAPSPSTLSWFGRVLGSRGRWLVPAAALLVVAVASLALLRRQHDSDLRADAGNGPVVYRSQEIEIVAPAGDLPGAPERLDWKAVAGASEYKVSIMEVDQVALWSAQTRDIDLTIPDSIRTKILPGKPLLWRVTAVDNQGRVLATSQIQHFSVLRKSAGSPSGTHPQ